MIFKALNTEEEWLWVAKRANCNYCEDTKGIVAWKDGSIQAAIVLDSWSFNAVTIHIAVENPLVFKHGFAEVCFVYIFNTCDKGVLIGITPADNKTALRFNRKIGLTEIYRVKDGYKVGVDYVVQELRKEDCKYLRESDGQEIYARSA